MDSHSLGFAYTFDSANDDLVHAVLCNLKSRPSRDHEWTELFRVGSPCRESKFGHRLREADETYVHVAESHEIQPIDDGLLDKPTVHAGTVQCQVKDVADLTDEIKNFAAKLKRDMATSLGSVRADSLHFIVTLNSSQVEELCHLLGDGKTSELAFCAVCDCIVNLSQELSYSGCRSFLGSFVLPHIMRLPQNSRQISASLLTLARTFPRPYTESVLVPCAISLANGTGDVQGEVLGRIVKEGLTEDYKLEFLRLLLKERVNINEALVLLIDSALDSSVPLGAEILSPLINCMVNSSDLNKSLKFTKMLLTIIQSNGDQFTDSQFMQVGNLLMVNKTFLKRACENALQHCAIKRSFSVGIRN